MMLLSKERSQAQGLSLSSYAPIAEALHKLADTISKAKFFSILLDGSTDKGNIDNELMMIVWCDVNGEDEKMHTRICYFNVIRPHSVTAEGLFEVVETGLG